MPETKPDFKIEADGICEHVNIKIEKNKLGEKDSFKIARI